jgi:hypothetical protein
LYADENGIDFNDADSITDRRHNDVSGVSAVSGDIMHTSPASSKPSKKSKKNDSKVDNDKDQVCAYLCPCSFETPVWTAGSLCRYSTYSSKCNPMFKVFLMSPKDHYNGHMVNSAFTKFQSYICKCKN